MPVLRRPNWKEKPAPTSRRRRPPPVLEPSSSKEDDRSPPRTRAALASSKSRRSPARTRRNKIEEDEKIKEKEPTAAMDCRRPKIKKNEEIPEGLGDYWGGTPKNPVVLARKNETKRASAGPKARYKDLSSAKKEHAEKKQRTRPLAVSSVGALITNNLY